MVKMDNNVLHKRLLKNFDKIVNILNKLQTNESIAIILSLINGLKISQIEKIGCIEIMKNRLITEVIDIVTKKVNKWEDTVLTAMT